MSTNIENRLGNAYSLLKRAKKDYEGFVKAAGTNYLRHDKGQANDPALAVYHLQQVAEKTAKAIAIASGRFTMDDFRQEYRHNSLDLYCEFFLEVIRSPLASILDTVTQGSNMQIQTVDEFQRTLQEIQQNIDRGHRPPDAPNWWRELQTASPEQVDNDMEYLLMQRNKIVSISHQKLKSTMRFTADKLEAYRTEPTTQKFIELTSSAFSEQPSVEAVEFGTLVMSSLAQLARGISLQEYMKQSVSGAQDGEESSKKYPSRFKRDFIDSFFLTGWAVGAMLFLAAYTFPHEATTRYPEDIARKANPIQQEIIDCESYSEHLGIVSCMPKVGRLASLILGDIQGLLDSVSFVFSLMDDSSTT